MKHVEGAKPWIKQGCGCSAVSSLKQKRRSSVEDGLHSALFHVSSTRGQPQKSWAPAKDGRSVKSSPAPTFSAEMKIERTLKWGRNGDAVGRAGGSSMHVPTAGQKWCRHSHLRKETAHDLAGALGDVSTTRWVGSCSVFRKGLFFSLCVSGEDVQAIVSVNYLNPRYTNMTCGSEDTKRSAGADRKEAQSSPFLALLQGRVARTGASKLSVLLSFAHLAPVLPSTEKALSPTPFPISPPPRFAPATNLESPPFSAPRLARVFLTTTTTPNTSRKSFASSPISARPSRHIPT
jgi:hypothetical protein